MEILLTGATGFIGRSLISFLKLSGHKLTIITRRHIGSSDSLYQGVTLIEGDLVREQIRDVRLRNINCVINLMGENIGAGRWTKKRKIKIYESRVKATQNLISSLKDIAPVKVFVSMSAVGIYGDRGDEILTEQSLRGEGFLSTVCQDWEAQVLLSERKNIFPGCRFVIFRSGVVLAAKGGVLDKLAPLFRFHLMPIFGGGQQWISWIHIMDVCQIFLRSLTDTKMSGIFHLVSPEPVMQKDFVHSFTHTQRLTFKIPLFRFFLKLFMGEMSSVVLDSQRAIPERLNALGYSFEFAKLSDTVKDLSSDL